jgi:hypothetical protein
MVALQLPLGHVTDGAAQGGQSRQLRLSGSQPLAGSHQMLTKALVAVGASRGKQRVEQLGRASCCVLCKATACLAACLPVAARLPNHSP